MDIVKKNMWSIVCGVVAVLAVVATYYPLGGKFVELNEKLSGSVAESNKIRNLTNLNPNMPVIDPKSNEVKQLGMFPTEKVTERGKAVVGKVHTESEKLNDKALEMNRRQPLANALPNGRGRLLAEFKDEYYRAMDQLRREMRAATTPTEDEIRLTMEKLWKDEFEPMIGKVGDVAQGEPEVRAAFEERKKDIPKQMRIERAEKFVMYVNPEKPGPQPGTTNGMTTSFDYHPGIPPLEDNKLPDLTDIWCAQLGYWIQEDVVRAIIETNKNAKKVDEAIVKRLIRTDIRKEYITNNGPVAIQMALNPSNVPAGPQEASPPATSKFYGFTATGRVCNPDYDVMHFSVTVDADAQRFQTFINNLTRGKFITILRINMRGVDRERIQQTSHYYYGKQPVVRMEIKAEAIFFRSWTAPKPDPSKGLMPVNVQKLLKIPPAPTGVAEVR